MLECSFEWFILLSLLFPMYHFFVLWEMRNSLLLSFSGLADTVSFSMPELLILC
jgi:hypothetical protein